MVKKWSELENYNWALNTSPDWPPIGPTESAQTKAFCIKGTEHDRWMQKYKRLKS